MYSLGRLMVGKITSKGEESLSVVVDGIETPLIQLMGAGTVQYTVGDFIICVVADDGRVSALPLVFPAVAGRAENEKEMKTQLENYGLQVGDAVYQHGKAYYVSSVKSNVCVIVSGDMYIRIADDGIQLGGDTSAAVKWEELKTDIDNFKQSIVAQVNNALLLLNTGLKGNASIPLVPVPNVSGIQVSINSAKSDVVKLA